MQPIETSRLLIRSYTPNDWSDLYDYLSDPDVVRYEPYHIFTREEAKKEAIQRAKSHSFFAVCLKDNTKLIGNISLQKGSFSTWELGYVFHAAFQGKGYATEAAHCLMQKAFTEWGARRIIALCNPLNTPSWHLLERLGFRREGTLLKNIYFKYDTEGNPLWADTYEYAILKEEWRG